MLFLVSHSLESGLNYSFRFWDFSVDKTKGGGDSEYPGKFFCGDSHCLFTVCTTEICIVVS